MVLHREIGPLVKFDTESNDDIAALVLSLDHGAMAAGIDILIQFFTIPTYVN